MPSVLRAARTTPPATRNTPAALPAVGASPRRATWNIRPAKMTVSLVHGVLRLHHQGRMTQPALERAIDSFARLSRFAELRADVLPPSHFFAGDPVRVRLFHLATHRHADTVLGRAAREVLWLVRKALNEFAQSEARDVLKQYQDSV